MNNADDNPTECGKCKMGKEAAMIMKVMKKKNMCEECGHRHREDFYCHVYTEAADEDDEDDALVETESESEAEEEDNESDGLGLEDDSDDDGEEASEVELKQKPLTTPNFAKKIKFIRCNCKVGVPMDSKRFEPLPRCYMIGTQIWSQTYLEIMDDVAKKSFNKFLKEKYNASDRMTRRTREAKQTQFAELLPHILSYLPYGECNKAPMVSKVWNYGTNLFKEYVDIRNFIPFQVYRPHEGQVDSILLSKNNKIYSGGDRRVLCTQMETGNVLSMVTRDSGALTTLFEMKGELFCCSSNGSIRTFLTTETGKNMPMMKTM